MTDCTGWSMTRNSIERARHRWRVVAGMLLAAVSVGLVASAPAGAVSFGDPSLLLAGGEPIAIAVADFNGDSDPDLAVANDGSGDVSVLLGGAGASFGAATTFDVGSRARSVAVADFNGDADPDLAVANLTTVSVLLGGAGASFAAPINFTAGTSPVAVAVGGRIPLGQFVGERGEAVVAILRQPGSHAELSGGRLRIRDCGRRLQRRRGP